MTTYDLLWTVFLENCRTSDINLPSTDVGKYEKIHNAIRYYNNRMETDLTWNDTTEVLNEELDDDHLLILAHFMRLNFLDNDLTDFVTTWGVFTKEVGQDNYSTRQKGKQELVDKENITIDKLILNLINDWEI